MLGRADARKDFVNAMGPGLKKGYATATSDSGHHGTSVLDASWADRNPPAERDWAWRSIGETHRLAQAMIEAFYEKAPARSYFQGCSTGGRMANMAALKYPQMFGGIISGAPALDYTGLVALNMAWIVQANTDADGNAILQPGKDGLIGDEVMRQCDAVDGKTDGLIDDPRDCSVDLSVLRCADGAAATDCLSDAELGVIAKWRQGPRNAAGEQLYPGGIPEGSEPFWWLWLTGKPGGGGKLVPAVRPELRRLHGVSRGSRRVLFAAGLRLRDGSGAPLRDGGGLQRRRHRSRCLPRRRRQDDRLARLGRRHRHAPKDRGLVREARGRHGRPRRRWRDFARLFMIPGMDHCGLLPGPGGIDQWSIDPLGALEAWVEGGTAPGTIMK